MISTQSNIEKPFIDAALKSLQNGASEIDMNHSALLPMSIKLETERSIANTFGADFTSQISKLTTGNWQGPIISGFGTHLVKVSLNQTSTPLNFNAARAKVSVDYAQQQRDVSAQKYYEALRGQYQINVETKP